MVAGLTPPEPECGCRFEQMYYDQRRENERLRTQLAGCAVAALGGTKDPAKQGDYGWSPAYQDVLNLREDNERLRASATGWEEEARRSHQNVAWREVRIEAALALALDRPRDLVSEGRALHEAEQPTDRYWLGWDDAMEQVVKALTGEGGDDAK